MGDDKLRVQVDQRMDFNDFDFAVGEMSENHVKQLVGSFLTNPSGTRTWILDGFAIDCPSAKQLRVTKGRAILARRDSGTIRYGAFATEGDATKIIDMGSYTPGTYGVYIRFEYVEGSPESRIFWSSAGVGSEYAQTVNTRYLANWNMTIETASPGAEWLKIAEVDQATLAPSTTGITDQRDFFFEGPIDSSYQSGWSTDGGGVANDRNSDRSTYGVKDLQTMSAAFRQCIEDLKGRGLKRWWDQGIGGMNIGFDTDPTTDRLAVGDANFYMDGSSDPTIVFDTDDKLLYDRASNELDVHISAADRFVFKAGSLEPVGNRDLGAVASPWQIAYSKALDLSDGSGTPSIDFYASGGPADEKRWTMYADQTGVFYLRNKTDASGLSNSILRVTRNGSALEKVEIAPSDSQISLGTAHDGTASEIQFGNNLIPSGSIDVGSTAAPWQNMISGELNAYGTDPKLTFTDTNGTADEKTQLLKSATDQFLISGVTDGAVEEAHLTFVKNASAQLTDLVFGDSGAPIYKVRPHTDQGGNLGDTSQRWNSGYVYSMNSYRVNLEEDSGNSPYLELKDQDATNDVGLYRMEGAPDALRIRSHQYSTPANAYAFLEAYPNVGTAFDYEILDIVLRCVGHVRADESCEGVAVKSNTSSAYGSGYITYTGEGSVGNSGATFTVKGVSGATTRDSAGFLKIYFDTTTYYIPVFDAITG